MSTPEEYKMLGTCKLCLATNVLSIDSHYFTAFYIDK